MAVLFFILGSCTVAAVTLALLRRAREVKDRRSLMARLEPLLLHGERVASQLLGPSDPARSTVLLATHRAAVLHGKGPYDPVAANGSDDGCSAGPSHNLHGNATGLAGVACRPAEPDEDVEPDRFFTLALDMLCVADFDGYFRRLNPAWERTLGWTSAELQARPYLDFVHPDDRAATKAEARKLTTGRDTLSFENRYLCKDGSYRWLLWSSTPFPGQRLIYAAARDITDWRRTAEEYRVARDIQQKLFPASGPGLAGFEIAGASFPLGAAGGDYFDYLPLHGGGLGVVVGDAAGHGVGPALLMATTRASLHALGQTEGEVGTLLTLTNRLLADIVGDRFVTLVLARLDPGKRSLVYSSAGHPAGYVLDRSGAVKTRLQSLDPPLGTFGEHVLISSAPLTLEPGELVLLLTDGFLEACSPNGTAFGAERALGVVRANRHRSARDIVAALYREVRAFSGNRPQLDDITALVIKVADGL